MGMLCSRLGMLAYQARENTLAFDALLHSQEILSKQEMLSELVWTHIHLGWAYQREKDFTTAQKYAELSLAYAQNVGDDLVESQALLLAGSIANRQGNNRDALTCFDQALILCRRTGNPRQLVAVLNRLGNLVCYEGQYEIAVGQFSECLEISRQLNDRYNQAILLNNLGTIYHLRQ